MVEERKDGTATATSTADVAKSSEKNESSINFLALFLHLLRGKKTILTATFVMFALATVYAFLLTPVYTSSASFIPPALGEGNSLASALAGQLSAMGGGAFSAGKSSGDLYAGILKSRSVLSDLVKQFDLMRVYGVKKESQAESVLALSTALTVDAKSSIVTVSVTNKSPALAQSLTSAYMDALRSTDGRLALSQSSQRRLFFGQQLAKEKDALADAEVDLKRTEEQSGLIAPAGQTESEIKTVAETRAQIAGREVQLAALRQSATDQNPEVIRLRSEIANLEGQLAGLQRGTGSGSSSAIPTSKVPQLQLDYVRKEREVKYHEALFDILSRQYEVARLDEARDAPLLQVLDAASYPDLKSGPRRMYIMLGGLVAGFLGSCVWVLVRDRVGALRATLASVAKA